jgi:protein gp37
VGKVRFFIKETTEMFDYTFIPWVVSADKEKPTEWAKAVRWNGAAREGKRSIVHVPLDVFASPIVLADGWRDFFADWRSEFFELMQATPNLVWVLRTAHPETSVNAGLDSANVLIELVVTNQDEIEVAKTKADALPFRTILRISPVKPIDSGQLGDNIFCVVVEGDKTPMHPNWVRSLRDQALAQGKPFVFTGWGKWAVAGEWYDTVHCVLINELTGEQSPVLGGWGVWADATKWEVMRKFGKKQTGRELDGVVWELSGGAKCTVIVGNR